MDNPANEIAGEDDDGVDIGENGAGSDAVCSAVTNGVGNDVGCGAETGSPKLEGGRGW